MNKIVNIDRTINWTSHLCKECCKDCKEDLEPCMPLEMFRQLVLKPSGEQVSILIELKNLFEY